MNRRKLVVGAAASFAAAVGASSARACNFVRQEDTLFDAAAGGGWPVWIGEVADIEPEQGVGPGPDNEFHMGVFGWVRVRLVRPLSGEGKTSVRGRYGSGGLYCGYPWEPQIGERVIVIERPDLPIIMTAAQGRETRYSAVFKDAP